MGTSANRIPAADDAAAKDVSACGQGALSFFFFFYFKVDAGVQVGRGVKTGEFSTP